MGVCGLPAKTAYFPGYRSAVLPQHPSIKMSRTMFEYLWKYFHTSSSSGDDADNEIDLREEEEEMLDETFQQRDNEDHRLVDTLPKRSSLKYALTMDNFFNQPVVIEAVRERNVGSIGTFRRQ
jgi:hypothetical protein